jgi:Protein of unknown function (DUF2934)
VRLSKKSAESKPKPNVKNVTVVSSVPDAPAAPATPSTSIYKDLPEELIAARAYEKWERRGRPMGHASEEDWFAAKEELEQEQGRWTSPEASDRNRI